MTLFSRNPWVNRHDDTDCALGLDVTAAPLSRSIGMILWNHAGVDIRTEISRTEWERIKSAVDAHFEALDAKGRAA